MQRLTTFSENPLKCFYLFAALDLIQIQTTNLLDVGFCKLNMFYQCFQFHTEYRYKLLWRQINWFQYFISSTITTWQRVIVVSQLKSFCGMWVAISLMDWFISWKNVSIHLSNLVKQFWIFSPTTLKPQLHW